MQNEQQPIPQVNEVPSTLRPRWQRILTRVAVATLLFSAGEAYEAYILEHAQQDGTTLASPELKTIKHPMTLEVAPLAPEVQQRYIAATVGVYLDPHDGYGLVSTACTGTMVGPGQVLTAGHCLRRTYDTENKPYGILSEDGSDVRKNLHVVINGETFDVKNEVFFPDYDKGNETYDAELIEIDNPGIVTLPLAAKDPKAGSEVYLYSHYGNDDAAIYGGRVLGKNPNAEDQIRVIYKTDGTNGVCIPGTSGTNVIDAAGNVIGVHVAASDPFTVDNDALYAYHLDQSELGKQAIVCDVVPVSLAKQLVPKR